MNLPGVWASRMRQQVKVPADLSERQARASMEGYGGADGGGLEAGGLHSAERNHPNPVSGETAPGRFRSVRGTDRPETFEKEGLKIALRIECTVTVIDLNCVIAL